MKCLPPNLWAPYEAKDANDKPHRPASSVVFFRSIVTISSIFSCVWRRSWRFWGRRESARRASINRRLHREMRGSLGRAGTGASPQFEGLFDEHTANELFSGFSHHWNSKSQDLKR